MKFKDALATTPEVVEKKRDGDAWRQKKEAMEKLGKSYTPIWLPSEVVDTAKLLAKRFRVRYEEVLADALTDKENFEVFFEEMNKAK